MYLRYVNFYGQVIDLIQEKTVVSSAINSYVFVPLANSLSMYTRRSVTPAGTGIL